MPYALDYCWWAPECGRKETTISWTHQKQLRTPVTSRRPFASAYQRRLAFPLPGVRYASPSHDHTHFCELFCRGLLCPTDLSFCWPWGLTCSLNTCSHWEHGNQEGNRQRQEILTIAQDSTRITFLRFRADHLLIIITKCRPVMIGGFKCTNINPAPKRGITAQSVSQAWARCQLTFSSRVLWYLSHGTFTSKVSIQSGALVVDPKKLTCSVQNWHVIFNSHAAHKTQKCSTFLHWHYYDQRISACWA